MGSNGQDIVSFALKMGFQIHPDVFTLLVKLESERRVEIVSSIIERKKKEGKDFLIVKDDVESFLGDSEKSLAKLDVVDNVEADFKVIFDPKNDGVMSEGLEGYLKLFQSRLAKFTKIVSERPDSAKIRKIKHVRKESTRYASFKVAGLITEKQLGKNRLIVTVEDDSGQLDFSVYDKDLKDRMGHTVLDQMVVLNARVTKSGQYSVTDMYSPDVPHHRKVTRASSDVYAVFISDIHIGSKTFLADAFSRFIDWLSGQHEDGSGVAERIRYVVIAGDVVDGVGIYPDQENDLEETNIMKQYDLFAEYISRIPKHIKVFVSPGNHDAVRQALPQFAISKEYAPKLYEMDNVIMLGDPAVVRLHGVNVLIYHGQSLIDILSSSPGLSFDRPAEAMKILLQARHLAPIYGRRTSLAPETEDRLVISEVPDIFHTGHIHTLDSTVYRNIRLINSGTWQSQTQFQQTMGIVPVPAVAPIVNLSKFDIEDGLLNKSFR